MIHHRRYLFTFLTGFWVLFIVPSHALHRMSSDSVKEMASEALKETLYYNFENWIPKFNERIEHLKSEPETPQNRMELLKSHFYLAALTAEFCQVLSFTSQFEIKEVKEKFLFHSKRAKEISEDLIALNVLSKSQLAEAYFFLGASQGYIGLLEFGSGNLIKALINGLSADNHFEKSLSLNPGQGDAYVGLGVYRYGNARLGGIGNLLMQGGRDLRERGIELLETSIQKTVMARPLAYKTLIWFYISEQINPDNRDLPDSAPLSKKFCRSRATRLMSLYEMRYFEKNQPLGFVGNKGLAMMKAIQFILDENYEAASESFKQVLLIVDYLEEEKKYKINPQLKKTVFEGIKYAEIMSHSKVVSKRDDLSGRGQCEKILNQIHYIDEGGTMVEYESKKIREELEDIFYRHLVDLARHNKCTR